MNHSSDEFDLRGRRALVTGSSRGIGRAIALGLARHGADVAVHAVSRATEAQTVAERIEGMGVKSTTILADLSDAAAVDRLADQAVDAMGGIDILVLNASMQITRAWLEISPDEYETQMAVNVRASMRLMQRLTPGMIERRWGRVLTIGSVQQARPHPRMLVYAASKAALVNMVMNLARQLAPHHVTVNNLAPGVIETERNAEALADQAYRQQVEGAVPMRDFGQAEDCVGAALLMCSQAGRYITGTDLMVDGGLHLP
ncbi:MAG: SDR family oxidoreductase [Phycisphaeraceae bacterium]